MSMEKEVSTLRTVHAPAFVCPEAPEAFEKLKEHTREAVLDLLGRPPFSEPPALNPKILSETDAGGYLRKKVRYGNESDDVVWAWLLVPKGLTRPAPAILCFSGTFMTPTPDWPVRRMRAIRRRMGPIWRNLDILRSVRIIPARESAPHRD